VPDRPFMELSAGEVWHEVRQNSDAIVEIRRNLNALEKAGDDREARVRKLELRYYAILAGLVTGLIGYALTVARGVIT
jgi:hypothetical protein